MQPVQYYFSYICKQYIAQSRTAEAPIAVCMIWNRGIHAIAWNYDFMRCVPCNSTCDINCIRIGVTESKDLTCSTAMLYYRINADLKNNIFPLKELEIVSKKNILCKNSNYLSPSCIE